jgi:chromosome segregation ATPase
MQQHRSITLLRDEVAQLQQMLRLRDQVCELSHIVGDLQGRFQDLFENQVDAQNALAQQMASLQETVQEQQGRLHQLQELVHVHSMQLQSLGLQCARIGGF